MTPFGWWIAIYFALATVAAGAACAAGVLVARQSHDESRVRLALIVALGAVAVGSIALILDLERPKDFWLTLVNYNPSSWISRGSRIVPAFALLAGGLLLMVSAGSMRAWRVGLAMPLVALAALLAIYPAFVLGQEVGRPLWTSAVLPVLFLAGAIHVASAIARAPVWLEMSAGAFECGLFIAYATSIGFDNLLPTPMAITLTVVGALGTWILPAVTIRLDRFIWPRVAIMTIGYFGIRSAILYAGQMYK